MTASTSDRIPIAGDASTEGANGRSGIPLSEDTVCLGPVGILRAPSSGWRRAALTETLTESFCERCGTRYEFKAPTRLNPLRKTRGLIGGLKNYVMSQDDLGDALGDAMRSEEDRLASAQLEAFHESFNFCIDCRQYTCLNCWNVAAGRCRSCHPTPGTDDLAERLTASLAGGADAIAAPAAALEEVPVGVDSWPTSDLPEPEPALNGNVPEAWPVSDGFVYETGRAGDDTVRADDGFVYDHPLPAA